MVLSADRVETLPCVLACMDWPDEQNNAPA